MIVIPCFYIFFFRGVIITTRDSFVIKSKDLFVIKSKDSFELLAGFNPCCAVTHPKLLCSDRVGLQVLKWCEETRNNPLRGSDRSLAQRLRAEKACHSPTNLGSGMAPKENDIRKQLFKASKTNAVSASCMYLYVFMPFGIPFFMPCGASLKHKSI